MTLLACRGVEDADDEEPSHEQLVFLVTRL